MCRNFIQPLNVVSSLAALALLVVALIGTVYPVPSYPYNILPYVFVALLGVGVAYFLALRALAPAKLAAIEAEVLGNS